MSLSLSGIDVRVIVKELQEEIIGSWVVNIYHLPSGIFLFKLRKPQVGLQFLLIEPGKRIHLSDFNRIMPKEPSNFCKTLRSHLRDRRINSVEQRDLDRVVIINIGPDRGINIVIDLFGKGNMVMVSADNKIINAMSYRKMRDRDIHPGKKFVHMPAVDRDILRNGVDGLKDLLITNNRIIPVMNNWLGLGPSYSRYILKELGIKKKKTADFTEEELDMIVEKAKELQEIILDHKYDPVVYLDTEQADTEEIDMEEIDEDSIESEYDEQWSDLPFNPEEVVKILPWDQLKDDGIERYKPSSFGKALDIFFSSQEEEEDISGETEELSTATEKLTNQLNQQLLHQQNLLKEGEKFRTDADALYENFQPASELISIVYEARRNKMKWEDIISRLELGKEKGIPSARLFHSLQIKEATMKLELPNMGNSRVVTVDFRKSLTDNANEYYDKAKKNERKAKNADIAIERTRDKIKNIETDTQKLQTRVSNQDLVLKRRKAWYEKFHWTVAPNGMLIIAGTDASTNERIVKTYLDEDDLFLHADIQGAAATIIKTGGKEVNDNTMRIAGIISVSFSAAWKLQRPTADAYAVEKDQVSLSAPTGQFMPKGGFMIYGSKTFIKDLPLKLYIGIIVEKHWARLIMSTVDQIDNASMIAEIIPGAEQRGKIAKQMKKGFIKHAKDKDINKIKAIDLSDFALFIPGASKINNWILK